MGMCEVRIKNKANLDASVDVGGKFPALVAAIPVLFFSPPFCTNMMARLIFKGLAILPVAQNFP